MTNASTIALHAITIAAGVVIGAVLVRHCDRASSPAVMSDKVDEVRQQVDVKTAEVAKEAVTKRRQAAKRVDAEVQRAEDQGSLADYLGSIVDGGDGSTGLGAEGARGNGDDDAHSLAPGDAP